MRGFILPCLLASFVVTGCATKKYVSREVGEVNTKVDNLSTQVEQTQAQAAGVGLFAQAEAESPRSFRKRHGSCYP